MLWVTLGGWLDLTCQAVGLFTPALEEKMERVIVGQWSVLLPELINRQICVCV